MKALALVHPSDPVLWTPAYIVDDIEGQVLPYVEAARALMLEKGGVGLAATQWGHPYAWFLAILGGEVQTVINPVLLHEDGWNVSRLEGCLTWPGRQTYVPRRQIVRASWTDVNHNEITRTLVMGDARVWLHERDHTLGINILPRDSA